MKKIIPFLIILILFNNLSGQKLHIKNYTTNDGLPSSQVWCSIQDSKGYIWFGASGGLVRFNGSEFLNYFVEDGLVNNAVRSIFEDKGILWIATHNGISKFDGNSFKNYTAKDGLGKGIVRSITKFKEDLWFSTSQGGLSRFNPNLGQECQKFITYTIEDGLPSNDIFPLLPDGEYLWIGTRGGGLSRFDGKVFVNYGEKEGLPANDIWCLIKENSALWVGTGDRGVFKLENNQFVNVLHDDRFYCSTKNKCLWFGTFRNGAWCFKDDFKKYTTANGLINNRIYSILIDRENTEWFTTDKGISKLISKKFVNYLDGKIILTVYMFNDALWIGTMMEGLFKLKNNDFISYKIKDGLASNQVWALTSFNNKLWIGTYEGLNSFDGEKFNKYTVKDGLPSNIITDLLAIGDDLWIATAGGAAKFNNGVFTSFTTKEGLLTNHVWSICQDKKRIWFATYEGACCYDGNKFINYTTEHGLSTNNVRTIFKDSKGVLWFGTELGLNKFCPDKSGQAGKNFTAYTKKDGLSNNYVSSIIEFNGNLWLGTDKGLNIFKDGKVIKIYTVKSGLASDESSTQNSLYVDKEHNIWFGSTRGLTKYIPQNDILNTVLPPVYIEKFFINDSLITDKTDIEFNYNRNNAKFSYIGLSFKDEDDVRYKYKLEGYDKNWSRVTQKTEVRYTNLNDGNYIFKVLAQNGDGYWSETPAEIPFKILPPFWETWWCIIIEIIIISLLIYGSFILKTSQIRRRAKVLEQKVDERTAELKETQKTLIDSAHRSGMSEISSGILHNVGNVLNVVKVSSQILKEKIEKSKVNNLEKVLGLLKQHKTDLSSYIASDSKGKMLPTYLLEVGESLKKEQNTYLNELSNLHNGINRIEEIIAVQQNYAGVSGLVESLSLSKMMDDVLKMDQNIFDNHKIKVIKHYNKVPNISVEKGKLIHIFINLIKNAWESLVIKDSEDKTITINISEDKNKTYQIVEIIDNGIGIAKENLSKIFSYGFTTKKNGKGFGLHTSALAISELNGRITAGSDGENKGAKFTVIVPEK
jgi:ligand-binding sensor domain-containing protein/signal transduction histidine kinase